MQVLLLPALLLALSAVCSCRPDARLLVTPAPSLPTPLLNPRQFDSSYLATTCGFIEAYILSPLGCYQGSVCVEDRTLGLAGGCCRIADVSSNCVLPTSCVPEASLAASCDASCSSNSRVTKCNIDSPYCYTNTWVSGDRRPTEVGCTTTDGFSAFVYTDYSTPGQVFSTRNSATSPIPTPSSSNGASGSTNPGASQQTSNSGNDQASDSGTGTETDSPNNGGSSGNSVNAGAIAGGVVGGVAVIGIAAGLITWLCLRHRRQKRNETGVNGEKRASPGASPGAGPDVGGAVTRKPVPEQAVMSPVGSTELAHDQNYRPNEVVSNENTHAHELLGRRAVPELP